MLQSSIIGWLILGIPVAFVVVAVVTFLVRWSRLQRRPKPDPETLLLGAVSTSLRERGELAASLGELRTIHERILEALPFGLLWVDARQRIAGLNAEGRRLLKVGPGVVGLEAGFVLEPFPWLLESFGRESGSAWRCGGGGRRWRLRRIEVPDKVGALLEFEDITDAEAEDQRRQLRERFAELGEMTAGVAHQLKNGLAVLKGHAQLLVRNGHEETGRELLEETESLEHVVQGFLQWARPLQPQCREVDLREVAAAVLEETRRRPNARGLSIALEGEGRALADPLLLHQALVNLVEQRRFARLERRHGAGLFTSVAYSLGCTLLAGLALLLSLPLWLVPPLVLVLPPLIWGWLTCKVMSFDALAAHASKDERRALVHAHRWPLLGIGIITGYLGAAPTLIWAASAFTLALAPVLILVSVWLYTLVFAFSALWFIHYALAALAALRETEAARVAREAAPKEQALPPAAPALPTSPAAPPLLPPAA